MFVAYADCGTGGALDALLARHPEATRLPGSHCYEFFSGAELFAALHEAELGTFYLTDFLAKHFEPLVWQGLGLDRHPELRDMYFGNYRRVVLLSQTDDDRSSPSAAPRPSGSASRSNIATSASSRSPTAVRMASRSRSAGGWRDGPRRSWQPRTDRHLLARHPRPGQRAGGPRPASGDARRQVPTAIDRAKRKAKIYTAEEDVAQWRRESRPIDGDLAAEAQAAADAIEAEYRRERLGLLAYTAAGKPTS